MSELKRQDVVLVLYRIGEGDLCSTHIFDNTLTKLDVQEYLEAKHHHVITILHIAR